MSGCGDITGGQGRGGRSWNENPGGGGGAVSFAVGGQGGGLHPRSANQANGGGYMYGNNTLGGDHDGGRLKDPEPDAQFPLTFAQLGELPRALFPTPDRGGLGGDSFRSRPTFSVGSQQPSGMGGGSRYATSRRRRKTGPRDGPDHELGFGLGAAGNAANFGGNNDGVVYSGASENGHMYAMDSFVRSGETAGGNGGGSQHHAESAGQAGGSGAPAGATAVASGAASSQYMNELVEKWKVLSMASFDILDTIQTTTSEERAVLGAVVREAKRGGVLDGTPYITSLADLLRGEDDAWQQQRRARTEPAEDSGGVGSGAAAFVASAGTGEVEADVVVEVEENDEEKNDDDEDDSSVELVIPADGGNDGNGGTDDESETEAQSTSRRMPSGRPGRRAATQEKIS